MTSFRTLLNVAYHWAASMIEGGHEKLDELLAEEPRDETRRRRAPDPATAALLAAFALPQEP